MFDKLILFITITCISLLTIAQDKPASSDSIKNLSFPGLSFRSIGPAFIGGRVVDIAVNPNNKSEYYVASGHGSLWKTVNNGVTYSPIFDGQKSYSIGAVKIDPSNPNIVWAGTGENNNQSNVIYGDGVYRSEDAGKSWKNMGIKNSEHIGGIVIDPKNSNTVYVAAYGSLRNEGGDRGIYKTTDGGKTWRRVLYISEYTGCFEVHMDPRFSTTLYAVAHQRMRKLYTGIRGGPESAIYRSLDSGSTWQKVMTGLPTEDVGRIGMAIAPSNPDLLYAIVEAKEGSGIYSSTDRGSSWNKQSSYISSYPFYMQKIFVDPKNENRVYSMDVFNQVTDDGGKTWKPLGELSKHVDNHTLWIDPDNTKHMLSGCDGGVYETWDGAKAWDFKSNLSLAEVYKVTTDNAYPFYNVYAGTQDNSSFGGPSRTINKSGISNSDWFITTGGDGFESQVDWKDPNIIYAQSQNGGLVRYDKKNGEELDIKPVELNDSGYRFDWSSPLLLSRHNNKRVYFGANRLLRTNDQGNTWEEVSPDLTKGVPKKMQKLMNRIWSIDELAGKSSMAQITAVAESPLDENLLFAGSGDGLISYSSNGGKTWNRSAIPPGLPEFARISQIAPSNHSKQVAYAAAENFNGGNYKPFLYKTSDGGNSWVSINNNLPEKGGTYSVAEDHIDPNLLFVGTQFGLFFSSNGGREWIQIKNGIPPTLISDIEIQKRENDLVVSSFGRGIYILDDYSPLRHINPVLLKRPAALFPVKDALMFIEAGPLGYKGKAFQGESFFTTPNPEVGAVITYYIKDEYKTLAQKRRDAEKEKQKRGEDFEMPVLDSLRNELLQPDAYLLFTITDEEGNVIRKIKKNITKGVSRVVWDFRYPSFNNISLTAPDLSVPWANEQKGYLVAPGNYKVSLSKFENGKVIELGAPQAFKTVSLNNASLGTQDKAALASFNKKVGELTRAANAANAYKNELQAKLPFYKKAIQETPGMPLNTYETVLTIERKLELLNRKMNGDALRGRYESSTPTSLRSKLGNISDGLWNTTAAPTATYQKSYNDVAAIFSDILNELKNISDETKQLEALMEKYNAPFTPGRLPIWNKSN
ncbi:MAG TPA: hypothetical protein VK498_11230 [Ferruginibacter sp.]|nr:hypothetical protein [Ferruginibacter sp.]